jgi:hypothetical protein
VAAAVEVTAACGRFEIRQSSEGKRSASGFEAQVYSWVNQRYTWAVPRGPCRVYSSITDEYTRQIHRLTDEYTWQSHVGSAHDG